MRLIDADAFLEFNEELADREIEHPMYQNTVRELIDDAPTAVHRITIRDIIDLLDYDRTGIRTVRISDEDTKQTDTLKTSSYLLGLIEDTPVNCINTVGGILTMYCDFGEASDGTT